MFYRVTVTLNKNNVTTLVKGVTGIADTSNNLIIGPREQIEALNKIIKAKKIPIFGRFFVRAVHSNFIVLLRFIFHFRLIATQ